jgi:hypothetical protein
MGVEKAKLRWRHADLSRLVRTAPNIPRERSIDKKSSGSSCECCFEGTCRDCSFCDHKHASAIRRPAAQRLAGLHYRRRLPPILMYGLPGGFLISVRSSSRRARPQPDAGRWISVALITFGESRFKCVSCTRLAVFVHGGLTVTGDGESEREKGRVAASSLMTHVLLCMVFYGNRSGRKRRHS